MDEMVKQPKVYSIIAGINGCLCTNLLLLLYNRTIMMAVEQRSLQIRKRVKYSRTTMKSRREKRRKSEMPKNPIVAIL